MRRLLIGIVCFIINLQFFACRVYTIPKDDISIIASKMIDSLRKRPDMVFKRAMPEDTQYGLYSMVFPDTQDYMDDEGNVPDNKIATFERKFKLRYVFFEQLLPPYYKLSNPTDRIPVFSKSRLMERNKNRFYISKISGIEIGILPQLQGNKLKLDLFIQPSYWNKKRQQYIRIIRKWNVDGIISTADHHIDSRYYRYRDNAGWEWVNEIESDSVGVNDIARLCVESAKLSARNFIGTENERMFLDWRYFGQYDMGDEDYRVISEPNVPLDLHRANLEYFILFDDPAMPFQYEGEYLDDIKAGAYFLRPKYRLDGDRFYVEVEVYFAKVDDEKHLSYDLRRTDNYTYLLGSDNQWQLLK